MLRVLVAVSRDGKYWWCIDEARKVPPNEIIKLREWQSKQPRGARLPSDPKYLESIAPQSYRRSLRSLIAARLVVAEAWDLPPPYKLGTTEKPQIRPPKPPPGPRRPASTLGPDRQPPGPRGAAIEQGHIPKPWEA